jgi:hypothetical protein
LAATPSSAATQAWYYGSTCPHLNGCGMTSTMGYNGAVTDDGSCPGTVGERIEYYSGGYWISPTDWEASFSKEYHSGTVAYEVFH